jgi:ribonucleotide monophosphatase NagD (HAD superfamily)
MADLRDVELALVDLDGTVCIGARLVSGAVAALAKRHCCI